MRDLQVPVPADQVVVKQDIQIQGAGAPAQGPSALRLRLDSMKHIQQLIRRQERIDLQAAVQEIPLGHPSVGLCLDQG